MAEVNRRAEKVKQCEVQKDCGGVKLSRDPFISSLAVLRLGTPLPFAGSQLVLESQANWDALPVVCQPPISPGVSSVEGSVAPSW